MIGQGRTQHVCQNFEVILDLLKLKSIQRLVHPNKSRSTYDASRNPSRWAQSGISATHRPVPDIATSIDRYQGDNTSAIKAKMIGWKILIPRSSDRH